MLNLQTMTPYIVSARKYRPDTFEELVGQDNIAQTLKNSILRGQLAHAYLFCGPRGVGKTTTARIFAKAINCSNLSENVEPCGHCASCQSFDEGRSYCIHELDAASNNGVEDIKTLMEQVRIPPQVGKYSVYIIDEVHMLSQSAFNAFLKTLEEPPSHAIFILATTEKHKILPTILSRCQTYDFNRITVDKIVGQLREIADKEEVKIDDESLHVIAVKADGALRDALTIFDQTVAFCGKDVNYSDVLKNLNVLDYEYSFSLVENFLSGDYASALLSFDDILTKGFNALHFVAALSSHFRDLLVSKSGALDALLELPDSLKRRYAEQSAKCSQKFLYTALGITTACEVGYRTSVNPRLHIEFALMRLCSILQKPSGEASGVAAPQAQTATQNVPQNGTTTQPVAPAPTPQPTDGQASATETPAPTRRTRGGKATGAGLSLKSLTEEAAAKPVSNEAAEPTPEAELTEDFLRDKWKALADSYASSPRLSSTISEAKLEFSEAAEGEGENAVKVKVLIFKVINQAQKEWIESKKLYEMEGKFQQLTGSKIALKVDVVEEAEAGEAKPYLPSEKAKDLMDRNEEVRELVKDLELDIK